MNKSSTLIMTKYLREAVKAARARDSLALFACLWKASQYAPNAHWERLARLVRALDATTSW